MRNQDRFEEARLKLQASLDIEKTSDERNRMGQFATPTALAQSIVTYGISLLQSEEPIRFFDPAIGTGSFYSALRSSAPSNRVQSALGYEIDPHYGLPSKMHWGDDPLEIRIDDFTTAEPKERDKANLLICNPPYVRHHHMSGAQKEDLQHRAEEACGIKINGLSGLYCYFLGLSHKWMADGAVAGWLIPSEFMDVNYGKALRSYLLKKVTLLHIHRFDPKDAQFADALVSSAVVWFRNAPPPRDHSATFSFGGTLNSPMHCREVKCSDLARETKWTRYPQALTASVRARITLGDLFEIRRGLATGDNSYFIMDREQIEVRGLPQECFTPVLPGPRYIHDNEIMADDNGLPMLPKQLFLLDTRLSEDDISNQYPALGKYLRLGSEGKNSVSTRYLCKSRRPWYSQENRPAAPIVCTYMGRGRHGAKPFRFILNHSKATACNVFLMLYPKPALKRAAIQNPDIMRSIWQFLNAIDANELVGHGRVYGGGLYKLEPKELRGFPADRLVGLYPEIAPENHQEDLLSAAMA